MPEDIKVMYLGKMAITFIKSSVRFQNMLLGYQKSYTDVDQETWDELGDINNEFGKKFDSIKRKINKNVDYHPLVKKFIHIRGITGYQIAILMALIKDIGKFDTASKLAVYSGLASINGMPVTKANLNQIKKYYTETKNQEFKGFNTQLSGRFHVIAESVLKQKGWFYEYYQRVKKRIMQRCMTGGEVFICTKEQAKESKGKMKEGRLYMHGRKNFSLDSFADKNAKRRIMRIFLHIFWVEWRELRGLPTRAPYPIDYLGHTEYIKLDDLW